MVSKFLPSQRIDRRSFLKDMSSVVAISLSISHSACKDENYLPSTGECSTTDDILGPFYKPGAPFLENIIPAGVVEVPLIVQGKVISDCISPLKGALVEIWNADVDGNYDMSEENRFRGSFMTDDEGKYRFFTIIPGRYLNGQTFRPSHIHFRITAPGYQTLVSQIYFKNDPYIASDPWASRGKASERILTLEKDDDGTDTVHFDIYLTPIQ
jgi:catechol 1,2-dioxygenase